MVKNSQVKIDHALFVTSELWGALLLSVMKTVVTAAALKSWLS
jgi:hypothetical protein